MTLKNPDVNRVALVSMIRATDSSSRIKRVTQKVEPYCITAEPKRSTDEGILVPFTKWPPGIDPPERRIADIGHETREVDGSTAEDSVQ